MSYPALLVFIGAYAVAVASPGPGVAAIIARALGSGLAGMGAFVSGFVVGDAVWLLAAVAGLGVIAQAYGEVLTLIKYAGAAYLLWIAWKMWSAPVAAPDAALTGAAPTDSGKLFMASLTLTLGNPKPIVFFMAVLPSIVDLRQVSLATVAVLLAVIAVVIPVILLGYAVAADRARRLFRSPEAMRRLNRGTGVVMAAAAVAVAKS